MTFCTSTPCFSGSNYTASEYLPLLAWEPVLGHAGDPVLIDESVGGDGSRFGLKPGDSRPRDCDHTRPERSACERVLRLSAEPPLGWRAYLDRQHGTVASALGTCAASCRTPCSVMSRLADDVRTDLAARCALAREFTCSALVRLRHASPVGHGFGTPTAKEIERAWARTRDALRNLPLGKAALADAEDDSYPLPGLPALFSAIALTEIAPDTLLQEIVTQITDILNKIIAEQPHLPGN